MRTKSLYIAAAAGLFALVASSFIWFYVGLWLGSSGACEFGPTFDNYPDKDNSLSPFGKQTAPILPTPEIKEIMNSRPSVEKTSKFEFDRPIKENDKVIKHVIKKKTAPKTEERTGTREEKDNTSESNKNLVEGKFGTQFQADYGE